MTGYAVVSVLVLAWIVEAVTGVAWLLGLVAVALLAAVLAEMRKYREAQARTDERVSNLERALGIRGGE